MTRIVEPWGGGYREVLPPTRTGYEFSQRFPDEASCRDFLFAQFFPNGFSCPRCGGAAFRWLTTKHLVCALVRCRRKASLTAGTILHGCHKPLLKWFWAAFHVSQFGSNARSLQRALKLTYKVAWAWCHKLRRVIGAKTSLDAPFPPFDRDARERQNLPANAVAERWYRETHGYYRWGFQRASGLGACCERLTKVDWDIPEPPLLHSYLFRAYSGSLSDKHLRAYFNESEFRWNHRMFPPYENATKLIARFVRTAPCPYSAIVGERAFKSPLWVHRVVEPVTLETIIRDSLERRRRQGF